MQKNIFYTILLLLLTLVTGCSDKDKDIDPNILVLQASVEEITLDRSKASETAVTFTWNKGVDRGADYTIVYYFRLDVFGSDYENSTEPIEIAADGERTVSYTHDELYQLLEKKWNVPPGKKEVLQGRIVAKVNGVKFVYPEISYASTTVENYLPQPLFIMGDATIAGSDPTKALPITEQDVGTIYHWQGELQQGGFKFISTLGEELPSLNKGADNNTLVNRTKIEDPDNLFPIQDAGIYSILLRKSEMKIEYVHVPYTSIFLVGSGSSVNWEISKAIELESNYLSPNEFTTTVDLKEGEIKFYSAKDWDSTFFKPAKADASLQNDSDVVAEIGGEDLKWKVEENEAGKYKITINTVDMKIKFEKQ